MTTHLFIFLELKQTTKVLFGFVWQFSSQDLYAFQKTFNFIYVHVYSHKMTWSIPQSFKNYHIPHSKLYFWLLVLFSFLFPVYRGFLFHSFHFYHFTLKRTSSWIQVLVMLFVFLLLLWNPFRFPEVAFLPFYNFLFWRCSCSFIFNLLRRYLLKRA